MFKNILIPVALSPQTEVARVVAAARLLKSDGAKLTMLHVLEEVPHYVVDRLPEHSIEESRKRAEEDLKELASAIGADIECKIVEGHGARTIVSEARTLDIDCIVMGSHAPGLGDYLVGSTSAYVERHAYCSVFVIR